MEKAGNAYVVPDATTTPRTKRNKGGVAPVCGGRHPVLGAGCSENKKEERGVAHVCGCRHPMLSAGGSENHRKQWEPQKQNSGDITGSAIDIMAV